MQEPVNCRHAEEQCCGHNHKKTDVIAELIGGGSLAVVLALMRLTMLLCYAEVAWT